MKTKENLTVSELFSKASRMCSTAEHCISEVRTNLQRSTDDKAEIDSVIDRLIQERYIDEVRYAQAFINDKLRFAKWGRLKIQQELWKKQIPASIYRPILENINEEEYLQTIRDLIAAKQRSVKGKSDYEIRMKLARFVVGRGFEMEFIQQSLQLDNED